MNKLLLHLLRYITPFANDIANILTISGKEPFDRIYKPCPTSWVELEAKTFVDIIALGGIVWNVSYVSNKYGNYKGIIYGWMLIIVAFMIPNLTMELFVNYLCDESISFKHLYGDEESKTKECMYYYKLILGLSYLLILFILEIVFSMIIKGKLN